MQYSCVNDRAVRALHLRHHMTRRTRSQRMHASTTTDSGNLLEGPKSPD
jgi:hypothetical protein